MQAEQILFSVGGLVLILLLIALAIRFPRPSEFLHWIARVTMALAAAAVALGLTGLLTIKWDAGSGAPLIQASGSLAVFIAVYFFDPVRRLPAHGEPDIQAVPASRPDSLAIEPRPGVYYFIENKRSGKVLTSPIRKKRDLVVQMENTSGAGQQWEFIPTGEGRFRVVSRLSDYVLDVEGGVKDERAKQNGRGIITWPWPECRGPNQEWLLAPAGQGFCKIISWWSNKVLDVENGKSTDGARIVQWEDNGQSSQCWKLVPAG